jgi:hypothetical protein
MYCLRRHLLGKRRQTKHNLVSAQKEFAFYSVFFFQEQITPKLHNLANDPQLVNIYLTYLRINLNNFHEHMQYIAHTYRNVHRYTGR